ncbi:sodium-dependent glucose transporter 1A-like isoform X1 [Biomphalaria glabrata]|uniref:Sodium-dependent glucose transporter 1A-like isoform X1 n=2 Tax=Biomphalaria glabrata TaxID=6526 RepID=A0A9U8EMZ9_BIOGL|nr:sodium-dependent glucose transporter 1A-like isoform X1 [Biomphalaria glabrata]XP_013094908.2 sodium-dependent glucose transporter 1A-like isoform X1 [Biomphalaria glabrata]XP_055874042.1 sodium-dependent glucose transporter 1A-like isoform X1 [Biomphalaria glabrata]XP_055874043.1 sodium-dependent glucose transporter 1A-like isoform X1 [Biomphalaria glabrata]
MAETTNGCVEKVTQDTNIQQNGLSKPKQKSVLENLKDSHYRNKVLHSVWIAISLFSLGICVGQMGPSFLDLQIVTNTDVEKASAFFTGSSIGYLTGSILSGALYTRVNRPLLQFFTLVILGITTTLTPYCSLYPLMIFIRSIVGTCAGCVDTTGNAEHMRIWGNDGQVLMQLLHFSFALGGVISPLYSEPFLAEKIEESEILENITSWRNTSVFTNDSNLTSVNSTVDIGLNEKLPQTTNVHWAFLISGVWTFFSAIPFLVLFFQDLKKKKKSKTSSKSEQVTQRKLSKITLLFTIFVLCSFYMLYCCVEDTFASFLMTFLVKEYSYVSKSKGAFITAIYWASFAAARFSMIFISKFLKAFHLLCLCCLLMLIAYSSFFVSASFAVVNPSALNALIFFVVLAGISMSAVFPAGFSWTEAELLRVTGPISSCILVSASVGTMINPLMLGILMTELSNMWFCYLLLGQTVLLCCIFVFLWSFNRFFLNRHYGPLADERDTSLNIEVSEQIHPLNTIESNDDNPRI